MTIKVDRIDGVHFRAVNQEGVELNLDGSAEIGGQNRGFRPMHALLAAVAGCAGIDIVEILKKQKLTDFKLSMEVDGERQKEVIPSLWETIHITFRIDGNIDEGKAKRAVQLSMDKYCSVAKTLEKSAKLTWRLVVNGKAT
jgi:putative redox protein